MLIAAASAEQVRHGPHGHEGVHHLFCDACPCCLMPLHDVCDHLCAFNTDLLQLHSADSTRIAPDGNLNMHQLTFV